MTDRQADSDLDLPNKKSPAHLDQKILGYARDHAPERKPFMQPLWMKSMAAVSVVGIAVLLVYPRQLADQSAPAHMEEVVVTAHKVEAPAAARSTGQLADVEAERSSYLSDSTEEAMAAGSLKRGNSEIRAIAAEASNNAEPPSQAQLSMGAARPDVDMAQRTRSQPETTPSTAKAAPPAPTEMMEIASLGTSAATLPERSNEKVEPSTYTEETVRQSLQEIKAMQEDGDTKGAEQAWQILLKQCHNCDLPETLDKALKKYLTPAAESLE